MNVLQYSMKNILTYIFVTLGVIFAVLILVGVYLFVVDPYNIKPLIFGSGAVMEQGTNKNISNQDQDVAPIVDNSIKAVGGGFQLSDAQKQALVGLGIDPAKVPSSITSTQEACFVRALGAARVVEIKAGDVPNAVEFFKAKSCI